MAVVAVGSLAQAIRPACRARGSRIEPGSRVSASTVGARLICIEYPDSGIRTAPRLPRAASWKQHSIAQHLDPVAANGRVCEHLAHQGGVQVGGQQPREHCAYIHYRQFA